MSRTTDKLNSFKFKNTKVVITMYCINHSKYITLRNKIPPIVILGFTAIHKDISSETYFSNRSSYPNKRYGKG